MELYIVLKSFLCFLLTPSKVLGYDIFVKCNWVVTRWQ